MRLWRPEAHTHTSLARPAPPITLHTTQMRASHAALLLRAAVLARGPPASAAASLRALATGAGSDSRPRHGGQRDDASPRGRAGGRGDGARPPPSRLDEFGDALPPRVANAAGEGAPGWTLLGEDDALAAAYWALDTTGGRAPGAELNALLSRDAKDAMVALSAKGASVPQLAALFRVRRQRVAAVLALRAAEDAAREKGEELHTDAGLLFEGGVDTDRSVRAQLDAAVARVDAMRAGGGPNPTRGDEEGEGGESGATPPPAPPARAPDGTPAADLVQGLWKCDRLRGVGEAAVAPLPRFPAFALEPPDADAPHPPDEATPAASDVPAREAELAAAADAVAAAEFGERLARNAARVAAGPLPASPPRPRRPEGGWPLLVTPLGKRAPRPYVAGGDGVGRALTVEEAALVRRARPKARKRIV